MFREDEVGRCQKGGIRTNIALRLWWPGRAAEELLGKILVAAQCYLISDYVDGYLISTCNVTVRLHSLHQDRSGQPVTPAKLCFQTSQPGFNRRHRLVVCKQASLVTLVDAKRRRARVCRNVPHKICKFCLRGWLQVLCSGCWDFKMCQLTSFTGCCFRVYDLIRAELETLPGGLELSCLATLRAADGPKT